MTGALKPISQPTTPEKLKETVSATRLTTWLTCRLKFYFHYVLGIRKPKTGALFIGNAVHSALKLWNRARWRNEVVTVETLQQQFDLLWQSDQIKEAVRWKDENDQAKAKTTAWSLVDLYLQQSPIPLNERPEAVEVSLEADLKRHGLPRLIGILDLIRAGGRIVDYKSVGQTPNNDKALHSYEVQLSMYSILYRDSTDKQESGRDLYQLVKTKKPKFIIASQPPMTHQQQTRLFKQLDSYVEGLDRQLFVPSPGMQCMACSFFNECRRWS